MSSPAPFDQRYDLLVTYDVETVTSSGRKRLRRVAKICEGIGQRVQKSVFECRVTQEQFETVQDRLRQAMNREKDSLRIYLLQGGRSGAVVTYGRDDYMDFDAPLIT